MLKMAAEEGEGKSLHRGDLEEVLRRLEEVVEEKRREGSWRRLFGVG